VQRHPKGTRGAGAGASPTSAFVREVLLQREEGRRVVCCTCERRCRLVEGGTGWCRTRRNHDGVLYTLIYGAVSSVSANPIEKKPLYHFYPGTYALTAGSWGCNFGCPWCQNWEISKKPPPPAGPFTSPAAFVDEVVRVGCRGTSISFNEPTLSLEWSLEVFRLARARGLYNTLVTNGYMTPEALHLLVEAGLDGRNVDLKGKAEAVRRHCKGIDVERVWNACRLAREAGVHLELTTLVIPGVNDDGSSLHEIAGRILSELGADVPWHVSAYFPAYRFHAPPTSVAMLERAWTIGREAGLRFVYLGNAPGHPSGNTVCVYCGALLIERWGLAVIRNRLRSGCCSACGRAIAGVWGPGWADRAGRC
jgi:pyruvate formate lyase activating enzyme